MKFLLLLLSFYLLGLSCLPCSDSMDSSVNSEVTISAINNHQEHNHTRETCTPFCTCSCCAASVFFNPVHKVQVVKAVNSTEIYPIIQEDNLTDALHSIWQPPKIIA